MDLIDNRQHELNQWLLTECQLPLFQLHSLPGDASFRRYFRVQLENKSYIAMDAPPGTENCLPFVAIAKALRALNLRTPEIIASDIKRGFLLITDFGDFLFLKELNSDNAEKLYSKALDALVILQSCRKVEGWHLPLFTANFMRQELELFKQWFLQKHLNINLSISEESAISICFDFLAQHAALQPQVFMHRDYHSANLMVLPNNEIGILDFQDAFIGPVTYDLVSLLRDCYIAWPDELINKLVLHYWEQIRMPNVSADEFMMGFDIMGLQRHLKALLTFSRKFRRDNNPNYLQHIPRTLEYITKVSARYPECQTLYYLSQQCVQ